MTAFPELTLSAEDQPKSERCRAPLAGIESSDIPECCAQCAPDLGFVAHPLNGLTQSIAQLSQLGKGQHDQVCG